jgi:hypothetical protein
VACDPLEAVAVIANGWLDQLLDELQCGAGDKNGGDQPSADRSGRRDLRRDGEFRRGERAGHGVFLSESLTHARSARTCPVWAGAVSCVSDGTCLSIDVAQQEGEDGQDAAVVIRRGGEVGFW